MNVAPDDSNVVLGHALEHFHPEFIDVLVNPHA
jgi:hypothetical protein